MVSWKHTRATKWEKQDNLYQLNNNSNITTINTNTTTTNNNNNIKLINPLTQL
jgi:hypothetical protein